MLAHYPGTSSVHLCSPVYVGLGSTTILPIDVSILIFNLSSSIQTILLHQVHNCSCESLHFSLIQERALHYCNMEQCLIEEIIYISIYLFITCLSIFGILSEFYLIRVPSVIKFLPCLSPPHRDLQFYLFSSLGFCMLLSPSVTVVLLVFFNFSSFFY